MIFLIIYIIIAVLTFTYLFKDAYRIDKRSALEGSHFILIISILWFIYWLWFIYDEIKYKDEV